MAIRSEAIPCQFPGIDSVVAEILFVVVVVVVVVVAVAVVAAAAAVVLE